MMQTAARPSMLMAACLTLGLADLLFLNLVVFPRTSLLGPAGERQVATGTEGAAPAPVVAAGPMPRERIESPPPPAPPAATEEPPAAYGRIAPAAEEPERPQAILFATGIARLDREGREVVDRLAAKLMADLPSATLVIDGHADRRGEEDFNRRLSRARAQTVMRRLAAQGVPRNRLMVRGFGSRRPAVNSADPEGLRKNRRVEISVRRSTS